MKLNIAGATFFATGDCHDCNATAETWQIPGDMVVLHQGAACAGFRKRFTPTEQNPTCSRGLDEKGFDSYQGNTLDTKNPLGNQGVTVTSKHLDLAREMAGAPGAPNMTEGQVQQLADRLAASQENHGSQAAIQLPPDEAPASEKQISDVTKCPLCGGDLPEEMKA